MRQLRLIALISSLILLPGCLQTKLTAPLGREVRLLAQDEPVKFRTEHKNGYVLYGFVPI